MRSHRAYDISTIIIFQSEPAAKNISHIKLSYKSDPFQLLITTFTYSNVFLFRAAGFIRNSTY